VVAQAAGFDYVASASSASSAVDADDSSGEAKAECTSASGVQRRLKLYVDLHAHANKRGCFMYGNHHNSVEMRVQGRLYPFLVEQHCDLFEYTGCDFSVS
jgi:hypothetical protein